MIGKRRGGTGRWWLSPLCLAIVPMVMWLRADNHYRAVYEYNDSNPALAFQGNMAAINAYPWPATYRRQLILSFAAVLTSGADVHITDEAAERILAISASTGPNNAGVLLGWAQFLVMTGRREELDETMDKLDRLFPYLEETQRLRRKLKETTK